MSMEVSKPVAVADGVTVGDRVGSISGSDERDDTGIFFHALKTIAAYTLWPAFLVLSLYVFKSLWDSGMDPEIAMFVVYVGFFLVLLAIEYALPYKRIWLKDYDRQTWIDLTLTALYFVVNGIAAAFVLMGLVWLYENFQGLASLNVWPTAWPIWAQIALGIFVTDLGNNLAHRMAHEIPLLWRFHAIHHSAPRLGVITTGRFHPIDVIKSMIIGMPIPFFLGAPAEVVLWYGAINAYLGIMTHANIDFRCTVFNYIFNTPNVHRWHHSRVGAEGNTNYGEATIIWDRIFGSFFYPDPEGRVPPVNVGTDTPVPKGFGKLLLQPMTIKGYPDEQPTLTELPADAS